MTIVEIRQEVERLRDGVMDPDLQAMLSVAVKRLVPRVQRLTLVWISAMLRDEGDRAACEGRDRRAAWLTEVGYEVWDLCDHYHDSA
jgi:hypothetical protein